MAMRRMVPMPGAPLVRLCGSALGLQAPGDSRVVISSLSVASFSSKRRTRYNDDSDPKRNDKVFAGLRAKQQEQMKRLRQALAREDRDNKMKEQQQSGAVDGALAVAARTTSNQTSSIHQSWDFSHDGGDNVIDAGKRRKQMRDLERMMARKTARQERVKHLPLFRTGSALWRIHGGEHSQLHYDHLPSLSFGGPVEVIHSEIEELPFAAYLSQQHVIGVDTESMPRFDFKKVVNPVCLIQIATLDRSFLYRIPRGGALPSQLRAMLENPDVVKIGHSLDDDFRLLEKSQLVSGVHTTLDTLPIATKLGCLRPGLKTLCQMFLKGIISKEMQVSNWEAPTLSDDQIRYAATDAWAPLRVMLEMIQLDDAKPLMLVKNYNAGGRKTVNNDAKTVLSTLEECVLEHRSRSSSSGKPVLSVVSDRVI